MTDDPLDEIRRIRMQISAEHDHDIEKIGAYYMAKQAKRLSVEWGSCWSDEVERIAAAIVERLATEESLGRQPFPWPCQPECLWPGSAGPKLGLVCHVFWKWSHCCFQLDEPEWEPWNWQPYWPAYPCNQHMASRARLGPFIALEDGGGECIWPHPCMHGERPQ